MVCFHFKVLQFLPVKCSHPLCGNRWWCIIVDACSCRAGADKLLACYELNMISMWNKQDKTTVIVYSCLTPECDSVCYATCSGVLAQKAVKTHWDNAIIAECETLTKVLLVQGEGQICVLQTRPLQEPKVTLIHHWECWVSSSSK